MAMPRPLCRSRSPAGRSLGRLVAPSATATVNSPAAGVNRVLLKRGKGHARTHEYYGMPAQRRFRALGTSTLVSALLAFMLSGLVVAIADETASPAAPVGTVGTHG